MNSPKEAKIKIRRIDMKRTTSEGGFTLIELIMVIVILGILAVAVMGKYQNLQEEAKEAVIKGIAAELSSASKANFAKCTVNATSADCVQITSTTSCNSTAVKGLLTEDGGASFSNNNVGCTGGAGSSGNCTLTKDGHSAKARVFCTN